MSPVFRSDRALKNDRSTRQGVRSQGPPCPAQIACVRHGRAQMYSRALGDPSTLSRHWGAPSSGPGTWTGAVESSVSRPPAEGSGSRPFATSSYMFSSSNTNIEIYKTATRVFFPFSCPDFLPPTKRETKSLADMKGDEVSRDHVVRRHGQDEIMDPDIPKLLPRPLK